MKIILSRKGFDSENGRQPSPILPDGTLLSLPIPKAGDSHKFKDLQHNGKSYYDIIHDLRPNTEIQQNASCHLDPDLCKGLFGQEKSAAGHLHNKNVTVGDIFLFFGWFREAEIINGLYRYKLRAPDIHVIFGYLEIGKIYQNSCELPNCAKEHPHTRYFNNNHLHNTIYEAAKKLSLDSQLPGWGCLKYSKAVQLTKEGQKRSRWNLPGFFRNVNITYHDQNSFRNGYFQAANKGQEFVISEDKRVTEWAKKIIANAR